MSKTTYNADILSLMNLFEKITQTRLKDCFVDSNNLLTFIVPEIQVGKAVGKQALNVKKLERLLNRKIKIVGFNEIPERFIKNLIYPISATITKKDNVLFIEASDIKTKGVLIGRNHSNLKNHIDVVKKYFKEIETIKII